VLEDDILGAGVIWHPDPPPERPATA
jgi:hypothetical protein